MRCEKYAWMDSLAPQGCMSTVDYIEAREAKENTQGFEKVSDKLGRYRQTDLKDFGRKGSLTNEHILELLEKQKNKCCVCNDEVLLENYNPRCYYQFSVDRVHNDQPHDIGNVLISCYYCNCIQIPRGPKQCQNKCHFDKRILPSRESILFLKQEYIKTIIPEYVCDSSVELEYLRQIGSDSYTEKYNQLYADILPKNKNTIKILVDKNNNWIQATQYDFIYYSRRDGWCLLSDTIEMCVYLTFNKLKHFGYSEIYVSEDDLIKNGWNISTNIYSKDGSKRAIPPLVSKLNAYKSNRRSQEYNNTKVKTNLWIRGIIQQQNIKINTVGKDVELLFEEFGVESLLYGSSIYIDGICHETLTAYKFNSCFFNGCPNCNNLKNKSPYMQRKYKDLYEDTLERERIIRECGYDLITIWECEYDKIKKEGL